LTSIKKNCIFPNYKRHVRYLEAFYFRYYWNRSCHPHLHMRICEKEIPKSMLLLKNWRARLSTRIPARRSLGTYGMLSHLLTAPANSTGQGRKCRRWNSEFNGGKSFGATSWTTIGAPPVLWLNAWVHGSAHPTWNGLSRNTRAIGL
jgi:hypothetical protein